MPKTYKTYQTYVLRMAAMAAALVGLVYGINYIVDPFGYNNVTLLKLDRELVSRPIARNVLAAAQFHAAGGSVVFFGDSVMRSLPAAAYTEGSGVKAFNFAIGGSSLRDVMDVIDYVADKRSDVHTFIIGIPFREFDDSKIRATFRQNIGVVENAFALNTSLTALRASLANVLYAVSGAMLVSDAPLLDETAYWEIVLNREAKAIESRIGATQLKIALRQTVCRLKKRGKTVLVVIPPANHELRKVWLTTAGDAYGAYKKWLKNIATVYDFDFESPLTMNNTNFTDPLHLKPEVAGRVAHWLREPDPSVVAVTRVEENCMGVVAALPNDR